MCAGGHEKWGRDAAWQLGKGVRGLEGDSQNGGMVEVVGGGPWSDRRVGVRAAHHDGAERHGDGINISCNNNNGVGRLRV